MCGQFHNLGSSVTESDQWVWTSCFLCSQFTRGWCMTYLMATMGHIFKHSHKTGAAGQKSSPPLWKYLKGYSTRLQVLSTLHCFDLTIFLLDYCGCHWIWQLYWKEPVTLHKSLSQTESSSHRKKQHTILRMKMETNMKLSHLWPMYFLS